MTQESGRLAGRVALVIGAGQMPGENVGNGRAAAIVYAREGASVIAVDRSLDAAQDTVAMIKDAGGDASAMRADVTNETDVAEVVARTVERFARIDVLHNNVGIVGTPARDAPVTEIAQDAYANILAVNLQGMVLTCKHTIPVMREQNAGVITNIGSNAVLLNYRNVGYKTAKAGVTALTEHVATTNAAYGIRANVVLPGLIETPMAIEPRVDAGGDRAAVRADRASKVPLGRAGTAWDVANAALFLASDEASFITGASLVVDGGQSLNAS
jgi:NAD(P)-dependent dehydrogenase (short-subunit alcohol dehydrogenase family)